MKEGGLHIDLSKRVNPPGSTRPVLTRRASRVDPDPTCFSSLPNASLLLNRWSSTLEPNTLDTVDAGGTILGQC